MNMVALERFLEDFKYNLEFDYYVKLLIVYRNYQMIDLEKKSYQQLKKLKKEMHNNGDFETYRKTLSNLEKNLLLETDITSYKIIQQEIANYPEILFWFSLTKCKKQEEISKYNEASKLNRLIKNVKNTKSIAKFIGIHRLINVILPAIPTPRNVGINFDFWNPESFKSFIIRYFNLRQTKNSFLQLDTIEKEWLNYHGINYNNKTSILNFFTTQYHSIENTCEKQEVGKSKGKPMYSFYYLYVKEIVFKEKKKDSRAERCYDTLFVMHIIDFNSNIRKGKPEFVSYNKDKETTDLHDLFERTFNYIKSLNDGEDSTIPVFLFHTDSIENIMESYYQDIDRIPHYRLIPFHNHKEMNECLGHLSSSSIDSLDLVINILPNIIEIEFKIDVELEKLSYHTYTKKSRDDILKRIANQLDSILTPPALSTKKTEQ